jgi:hypothetical protein
MEHGKGAFDKNLHKLSYMLSINMNFFTFDENWLNWIKIVELTAIQT